ncbi:unnamed protein product [Effrenium voratum]|uniref:Glutaredoxin domain-containing protein n=1 Tax=Effrenium voratum TaxID=2562239 RepID=A0AA36IJH7_9DINO|nr:unnamed protein product [Effrenium voratum]CAJ1431613.1 unnamed protein product [Effrenium voratum]
MRAMRAMRAFCGFRAARLAQPRSHLPFRVAAFSTDWEGLSLSELRRVAAERRIDVADCFERRDLVQRLQASADSADEATCTVDEQPALSSMSIAELRKMIHEAGLNSRDLLEKRDFLERAAEAQQLLAKAASDAKASTGSKANSSQKAEPWDVQRYRELEVVLFARGGCPHCVSAVQLLRQRGLQDFELQDVEWSAQAVEEFRQLGGRGVPFFYSRKTQKSLAGWKPDATDLNFLIAHLQ